MAVDWVLLPVQLRCSETVLLQKCKGAEGPQKYHPITISDTMVRSFPWILAQRMEVSLPFNSSQEGFCASDDMPHSVWFIHAVIKYH